MNKIVIAGCVVAFGYTIFRLFRGRRASSVTVAPPPRHNWPTLATGPPLRVTAIQFENARIRHTFSQVSVLEVCQWFDETLKCFDLVEARDKFLGHTRPVYIKRFPNTTFVADPKFLNDFEQTVAKWVPRKHAVQLGFRFVASPFLLHQQHVALYGVRHGADCTCSGNYCRRVPTEHLIARIYCNSMWRVVEIVLAMAPLDLPGYVLLWIIDFLPDVVEGWTEVDKITLITNIINSVRKVRERRGDQ